MTAIFGIVGKCSEAELEAMASRLQHRGGHTHIWSPHSNVSFGEVRHTARQAVESDDIAASVQLSLDWADFSPADWDSAIARDQTYRRVLSAAVSADPVTAPAALDGMFAYAYWDSSKSTLVLAVDRINFRRIFYVISANRLVFATEYKALLALSDVAAAPNPDAFQYAISTVVVDLKRSLATNIQRLPQGYVACVQGTSVRLQPYWRAVSRPSETNRARAAQELRERLLTNVRQTALPYDRMAITLSGGLDSAGLLGLIRTAYPGRPVSTYTIGHSEEDPEITGARAAATHFGTLHHEYFFEPESIIDDLPRLVWLTEEFAAREESILQYQIESQIIREEPVLISGNGADMVFGGMPRHRIVRLAEAIPFGRTPLTELYQQTQSGQLPKSLRGQLMSWLAYRGRNVPPPVVRGANQPTRVPDPDSLADLIEQTIVRMTSLHYHTAVRSLSPIESLLPFLSLPVLDFSLTLPSTFKTGIRRQKIVLREALSPLLPDFILNRGKAIQRARHDMELSDVVDRMSESLLSDQSLRERGLIDPAYVRNLTQRPKTGFYSGDQLARIWMLLATELWCRAFVDNRGNPIDGNYSQLRAGAMA